MRSRHRPAESLLFAEFCKKFPVLRRMSQGDRFVPDCAHHHPVFRYRTPRVIRAFVPRIAGFFEFAPVSASASAGQKGGFDLLSLHRKIPFLTRISETGSMTGWWVASLCPSASTIQSSRTAETVVDRKEAVSAGILPPILNARGLCRD